ncbi:MAG TPA: hypothetical protein VH025_04020, partial [Solirubrobacteraceae bacterium]|nr:hypothetical protein [Solirubrobacteraceae bacterium]
AGALARWGMRTVWEQPRGNARVDIGGLLGLLPVLLENASSVRDGALTLVLEAADGVSEWSFEVRDGHLRTLPTPPARRREDAVLEPAHRRASPARAGEDARPKSKAVVRGDEAAWIAALGPQRDYSGLAFTGARRFARAILEALPGRP